MRTRNLTRRLNRWLLLLAALCLMLPHGSALGQGALALKSVREVDLRPALGDAAGEIVGAWMLDKDSCVLHRLAADTGDEELIILSLQGLSVRARHPITMTSYMKQLTREEGGLSLLFETAGQGDGSASALKVQVRPDGQVSMVSLWDGPTAMPDGQVSVSTNEDGSLIATEVATGKQKLLVQGVPASMTEAQQGRAYASYLQYQPFADDVGYDGKDAEGSPIGLQLPLNEAAFQENSLWLARTFYLQEALDAHRFLYTAHGWEWGAGFGIYDLQAQQDHRFTGRGFFYGRHGNKLLGAQVMADLESYEVLPLPASIQEQLEQVSAMEDGRVAFAVSPSVSLFALTGLKSRQDDAHTLSIADISTGEQLFSYDIDNPLAIEDGIDFYDDNHLLLFMSAEEQGSAFLYLFELERKAP